LNRKRFNLENVGRHVTQTAGNAVYLTVSQCIFDTTTGPSHENLSLSPTDWDFWPTGWQAFSLCAAENWL